MNESGSHRLSRRNCVMILARLPLEDSIGLPVGGAVLGRGAEIRINDLAGQVLNMALFHCDSSARPFPHRIDPHGHSRDTSTYT
jgi:hypothetical protein